MLHIATHKFSEIGFHNSAGENVGMQGGKLMPYTLGTYGFSEIER